MLACFSAAMVEPPPPPRLRCTISALALRYVVHAPGCTSALVQARTAAQLRETVGSIDLAPLPAACHEALVALCAVRRADGSVVQGGRSPWSWGAPTPRRCIEAALRVRHVDGGAAGLLSAALGGGGGGGTAAAAAAADLRRRFAEDGFVKLERAFPPAVATALVASMKVEVDPTTGAWYPMARRKHLGYRMRSGEYFRCDSSVALPNGVLAGDAPEMASLHGAIEELLDARLMEALQAGHVKVIIDGSELNYVNSSGMGVFISYLSKFNAQGGDLRFCALNDLVRTVVMTNDPFDLAEAPIWQPGASYDSRFRSVLRLDQY